MFDGISEIAARVSQLQSTLGPFPTPPSVQADSSQKNFQQALQQAQTGESSNLSPTAQLNASQFTTGTGGASQMPTGSSSSGLADLASLGLGGMNSSALSGLSLDGTGGAASALGLGASSGSDGLGSLGLGDPSSDSGLGALGSADPTASLGALGSADPTASLGALGSADPTASLGSLGGGQSPLAGLVGQIAQQQGVNPALAEAVAQSESGFNPTAVSPAGAQGLMQLMPGTFQQYASKPLGSSGPSGMPVSSAQVTQQFGPTLYTAEPPLDWNGKHYDHFHTGIDLAVPQGTPIRATMNGTIQLRSDPAGYGNLIVVRQGPWDVLYGHTSSHPANIQTGTQVKAGEVIGYSGSTGNSSGPHVHYEIRYQGQIIDPTPYLHRSDSSPAANPSPLNPVTNATAGVGYLKDLLSRYKNNVPDALAAYNAGPGAVDKYGGIPPYPETQNYVQKTLQNAKKLGA